MLEGGLFDEKTSRQISENVCKELRPQGWQLLINLFAVSIRPVLTSSVKTVQLPAPQKTQATPQVRSSCSDLHFRNSRREGDENTHETAVGLTLLRCGLRMTLVLVPLRLS